MGLNSVKKWGSSEGSGLGFNSGGVGGVRPKSTSTASSMLCNEQSPNRDNGDKVR